MEILSKSNLIQHLDTGSPHVQMWAAYHLTERWYDHAPKFIDKLLNSTIPEIKQSGIFLVGTQKLSKFAFPVFRIFNSEEGFLKKAAVIALAQLEYLELEQSLWKWIDELLISNEVNLPALQSATQSLLLFNKENIWWNLNKKCHLYYNQHVKSIALFEALCDYVETPEQLSEVVHHYSIYRNNFNDPQFLNFFLNIFGNREIIEFIQLRLTYGYSMRLIYQECLNILGWIPSQQFAQTLEKIETYCHEAAIEKLPEVLIEAIRINFPDRDKFLEECFLEQFQEITSNWGSTIIKIQDQEYFFLLSLPLIRFLKEAEQSCIESPETKTTQIARIFHSPFFRLSFMTQVINLLAEKTESYPSQALPLDYINDSPKDALWKLVTSFKGMIDYPFSRILPQPWNYNIPFLVPKLTGIYKEKFNNIISISHHDEINYALELFKRLPDEEIITLFLRHFTVLINQHYHLFFEFIEHIPDKRFIEKLCQHYREDETDIRQLIEFLCEIHNIGVPLTSLEHSNLLSDQALVRILCPECHNSYHYKISILYFDQEMLEQRRIFTNKDIWTTDEFICKNCHANLPFKLDKQFLTNLYTEMLTAHLLKLSKEEEKALAIYKPLKFPYYFEKKTPPGIFIKKVKADLKAKRYSAQEEGKLLLELGKLFLAIEKLSEAQEAFRKSLELMGNHPLVLFNLGLIAFRQKNLHDARLHFSRFKALYNNKDFESDEENIYELALNYLEILAHREFKRSTFRIIS